MATRHFYSFINHLDKKPEVNLSPSMTSTDLYLTTKQRVENLLHAGQDLLNSRLGPEYFEQNGNKVDESITDTDLTDLHDYRAASLKLDKKLSDAYSKVSSMTVNNSNVPTSEHSITSSANADNVPEK